MGRASSSNEDLKAETRRMRTAMQDDGVELEEERERHQEFGQTRQTAEDPSIGELHDERARQYKQLNIPISTPEVTSGNVHTGDDVLLSGRLSSTAVDPEQDVALTEHNGGPHRANDLDEDSHYYGKGQTASATLSVPTQILRQTRTRPSARSTYELGRQSAISNPFPANLPLSIIRLVESYVNQFVSTKSWTAAQGEKGYLLVSSCEIYKYPMEGLRYLCAFVDENFNEALK